MGDTETPQAKPAWRRGTEKRKKQHVVTFRMADEEYNALAKLADGDGLTIGSFIRSRVLAEPKTKRRKRPTVEVQAVTKLQGAMNRVGGNIHQILKRVNFGENPLEHEYNEALEGYREVIREILVVLRGRR